MSKLSPRTGTDFTIESLGIHGLNVGGPGGRPLRKDEQGFPVINIDGFLGMGDSGASSNLDNSRTYQFVDNVSLIRHGHSLKFGVDVRRLMDDATTNNWPFSNIAFTGDISGFSAAAFMLGYPRTTLTPEGVPISAVRQWRYGLYFQDDWKATRKTDVESRSSMGFARPASRGEWCHPHTPVRPRSERAGALAGTGKDGGFLSWGVS